jgi:hypothetical protein
MASPFLKLGGASRRAVGAQFYRAHLQTVEIRTQDKEVKYKKAGRDCGLPLQAHPEGRSRERLTTRLINVQILDLYRKHSPACAP